MKTKFGITLIISSVLFSVFTNIAEARVEVVTTLPDFASIVKDIGGDRVEVKSIVKSYQDPHFVDAKPNYILWLNKADLLVYNGLDLEAGWLPVLLTGSRNSKITGASASGYLNVSRLIHDLQDVPAAKLDRTMGDVHPGGNPHFMLNPENGIAAAKGIAGRLIEIDPENAEYYESGLKEFVDNLTGRIEIWKTKLKSLSSTEVITYHNSWAYFTRWAGLVEVGYIEPKPGVPPSPAYLSKLITESKNKDIKLILSESFYPQKTARLVAEKTGAELVVLPVMSESSESRGAYATMIENLVNHITEALQRQE